MKNITIYTLILIHSINILWSQQLPISNFYLATTNIDNPANIEPNYLKYNMPLTINVGYHYQWAGLEESPKTLVGNFQYFNDENNFVFGGTFIHDATNPLSFTGVLVQGAYKIQMTNNLFATVGISGGLYQYAVNASKIDFLDKEDVANQNIKKIYPDFTLGATLVWKEKYKFAFSVPQTFGLNLNFRKDQNDFNIHKTQHYYSNISSTYKLSNSSWFEPSLGIRYINGLPILIEGLINYEVQEKFWFGIGGSNAKNLHIEAGFIINTGNYSDNMMKIGYGFNSHLNAVNAYFGSTHEIKFTYSK